MRNTLDCDQVFDILTRGPFPTGHPIDSAVEYHLQCCHECRQLAEALRPAVELFHEAIDADECDNLPGYRGLLPDSSVLLAELPPATTLIERALIERAPTPKSTAAWWSVAQVSQTHLVRFAGGLMLGAALCLLVWGLSLPENGAPFGSENRGSIAQSDLRPAHFRPDPKSLLQLTSLGLTEKCRPAASGTDQQNMYLCCTDCHKSGEAKNNKALFATINSCSLCHK